MPLPLSTVPSTTTTTSTTSSTTTSLPDAGVFTSAACATWSIAAFPPRNAFAIHTSSLRNVEVTFGTLRSAYGTDDACVPVSLTLTNTGDAGVSLTAAQARALSDLLIGVYTNSRLFEARLEHRSGPPVQEGPFLAPGESTTLAAVIDRARFALYTVPPLGGGQVRRELNFEGPYRATAGADQELSLARLDFGIDLDFGVLPDSRVADPGAGVDFVGGEILVGFVAGVPGATIEDVVRTHGGHIEHRLLGGNTVLMSIPFDQTTGEAIAAVGGEPVVRYAERIYLRSID